MTRDPMPVGDTLQVEAGRRRDTDDDVLAAGLVLVEWFDAHGDCYHRSVQDNLVTAIGDRLYASRGAGLTTSPLPTGMKLGTGSTAVAKTGAGAALVTYLTGSNKAFDATFPSETGGVVTYKRTYAAGEVTSASNITEVAIVTETISNDDTSTAAETVSRALLASPAPKAAGDSLVVTWTHTILGA